MPTSRRMVCSRETEPATAAALSRLEFLEVVARTPLVSIDLIVRDRDERVLLGLRRNAPARGYLFVPGGRVRKNETLDTAFGRLVSDELGVAAQRREARFLGVFEHLYHDNAGELPGFGTHYVVLGYELPVGLEMILPQEQHSEYCWMPVDQVLGDPRVHENTKAYFR